MRAHVAELLEGTSRPARVVQALVVATILVSVSATFLETMPSLGGYNSLFDDIEFACTLLFSVEILLRWWSAGAATSPFAQRHHPRLAYVCSPGGIVDLVSVIPFFLGATSFAVVRSLRLLRILRLAKLVRYAASLRMLAKAIHIRRRELITLALLAVLTIVVSATLMYAAEHDTQPNTFTSMPDALWWALSTLSTVGYGDVYPVTPLGRVCASVIMVLGIGLVALPTGLIGSAFYELTQRRTCPHCGRPLADGRPEADRSELHD
jgi:voltage-gated potassium channel